MLNRILATLGVMAVLTLAVSCGDAARTNPSATLADASSQEPSSRVEDRIGGPPGDEADTGPVHVVVPNYPANPGPAETYGPLRLLPWGYGDPPGSVKAEPTCAAPGAALDDQAVLRASYLYVDEASIYIPAGFAYEPPSSDYMCGREVRDIVWKIYRAGTSGGDGIQISRSPADRPLDVRVPPVDSVLVLEKGTIGNAPAVFLRSKVGGGPQFIYMVDGGIATRIMGDGLEFSELQKVAESLR